MPSTARLDTPPAISASRAARLPSPGRAFGPILRTSVVASTASGQACSDTTTPPKTADQPTTRTLPVPPATGADSGAGRDVAIRRPARETPSHDPAALPATGWCSAEMPPAPPAPSLAGLIATNTGPPAVSKPISETSTKAPPAAEPGRQGPASLQQDTLGADSRHGPEPAGCLPAIVGELGAVQPDNAQLTTVEKAGHSVDPGSSAGLGHRRTAQPADRPGLPNMAAQDRQPPAPPLPPALQNAVDPSGDQGAASAVQLAQGVSAYGQPAPDTPQSNTQASAPASASAAPAVAQLGHAMALRTGPDGVSHMTLRLDPAELGMVQVYVTRSHDGTASIRIDVERADTLTRFQSDLSHLHQALDRAGMPEQRSLTLHLAAPEHSVAGHAGSGGQSRFTHGESRQDRSGGEGGESGQINQPGSPDALASPSFKPPPGNWLRAGINITA